MNDDNWSIKKLLKEIVMSATYRQDSKTNEVLQQKDPNNKLLCKRSESKIICRTVKRPGIGSK